MRNFVPNNKNIIMRVFRLYSIGLLTLCLLSGFAMAQKQIRQYDPESLFDDGVMMFNNKEYGAAKSLFQKYLSSTNDMKLQKSVDAQYYEAVCALYLGHSDGNIKVIEFVNENPGSSWAAHANFLYANSLFKSKKYRDALKIYEKTDAAILNREEAQQLQFYMAYSYFMTNNIDKALPLFKGLLLNEGIYQDASKYYYAHIQYTRTNDDEALRYFEQLRHKQPYAKIIPSYILQINYRNGNIDAVINDGEAALKTADRKRKAETAFIIADSWYQKKNYPKALEYYRLFMTNLNGREVPREAFFQMGVSKIKTNDYKGAISDLQRVASDKDILGQYASYYLAECYTQNHEEKYARNAFFSAYKAGFDPTISVDALFNYAKLSLIPGADPFNEAATQLESYIDDNPYAERRTEAEEILIYLLLNAKQYDTALDKLEILSRDNNTMKEIYNHLLFNTGIDHFKKEDYAKAQVYLSRIVNNKRQTPYKAEACFWLGESAYNLDNLNSAERYFKQFKGIAGASSLPLYSMADYNMGYIDYQRGDYDKAINNFRSFIQNSDDRQPTIKSDAYIRLGDCFFMERNYPQAINYYDIATRISTFNADYALLQQALSFGAQGKSSNKIETLHSLLEGFPNSTYYDKALFEVGNAHLITGDKRSAISHFDRLIKERPRSSFARQAMMKIGMIYYNNNQYDQALPVLKNIIETHQGTDEAREALAMTRNIYMERNQLSDFFTYVEKNGIGQINVSTQDSLAFVTAENFFLENRYEAADTALTYYLDNFKNGAFTLKAHHYALVVSEKIGTEDDITRHLEYILAQPINDYTDNALLKIARLEYDHGYYEKAGSYYERLSQITEIPLMRLEAMEGCMKSYYFLNNYDKAIEIAIQLSKMPELTKEQQNQIYHILGKAYYQQENYDIALDNLDKSAKNDPSAFGAESAYLAAMICFNKDMLDDAENRIFNIADTFSAHDYWVANSFILLADVYIKKDNIFQAKETLRSVADNYQGEDLRQIARNKLTELENDEKRSVINNNTISPVEESEINGL